MKKIRYYKTNPQKTLAQIKDFAIEALSEYSKEELEDMYEKYITCWQVSYQFWRDYPVYSYKEEETIYAEINRHLGTNLRLEIYIEELYHRHWALNLFVWQNDNQ